MVSNDQFQIPEQFRTPEEPERPINMSQAHINERFSDVVADLEHEQYIKHLTGEAYPERPSIAPEINPTFQHAKEVESKVEQLRGTADQTTIPRFWLLKIVDSVSIPRMFMGPKPLKDQLVDVEAYIGGSLIEESIRKAELAKGTRPKDIHITPRQFWYLDGYWYYRIGTDEDAPVSSYQLTEKGYFKSVNGVPSLFEPGEAEALLKTIPLYYEAVQKSLYQRGQVW